VDDDSFIEWCMRVTDEAIRPHGLLRNPPPVPEIPPDYANPRGLPEAWLRRYLSLDRAQLALDVIKAFDKNFELERANGRLKMTVWIMSLIVSPLIGEVVKLLFHGLLK
jgi:hypothetical protein